MSWLAAIGPCWRCRQLFVFSPTLVPSLVVNGEREPLCADCVEHANKLRRAFGRPLIRPLPGAYEPARGDGEIEWLDKITD